MNQNSCHFVFVFTRSHAEGTRFHIHIPSFDRPTKRYNDCNKEKQPFYKSWTKNDAQKQRQSNTMNEKKQNKIKKRKKRWKEAFTWRKKKIRRMKLSHSHMPSSANDECGNYEYYFKIEINFSKVMKPKFE